MVSNTNGARVFTIVTLKSIDFTGVLLSIDGKQKLEVTKTVAVSEWKKLGFHTAQEILSNGGIQLMSEIKENLK